MKKKVTEMNYGLIKRHTETHTWQETSKEFDLSKAMVQLIKRSNDYEDLRYIQKSQRRASWEARKKELGERTGTIRFTPPKNPIDGTGKSLTAAGDPFGEALKPKPITPLGAERALEQNGPITTTQVEDKVFVGPMTFDDYRREYKKLSQENGTLRGEIAVAKMEAKKWQNSYSQAVEKIKDLQKAYEAARVKAAEAKLNPIVKMPESKVENIAPTEIEITVGDATIKVSTKGVTNVNI